MLPEMGKSKSGGKGLPDRVIIRTMSGEGRTNRSAQTFSSSILHAPAVCLGAESHRQAEGKKSQSDVAH